MQSAENAFDCIVLYDPIFSIDATLLINIDLLSEFDHNCSLKELKQLQKL